LGADTKKKVRTTKTKTKRRKTKRRKNFPKPKKAQKKLSTLFPRGSCSISFIAKSRALLRRRKRLLATDTIEHKAVTTTTTRRRICLRGDV
jgi:hypothetical protein